MKFSIGNKFLKNYILDNYTENGRQALCKHLDRDVYILIDILQFDG